MQLPLLSRGIEPNGEGRAIRKPDVVQASEHDFANL